MDDQTPITWVDQDLGATPPVSGTSLDDSTLNTEIRNAYSLLLNPPTCQLHQVGAQTIASGSAWQAISWDTKYYDTEDPSTPMYSASSPTRITIQTPGWYFVNGDVGLGNDSDTYIIVSSIAARVNGTDYYNLGSARAQFSGHLYVSAGTLISLNSGDYVELMAKHTSTMSADMMLKTYIPLFTVVRWRGL